MWSSENANQTKHERELVSTQTWTNEYANRTSVKEIVVNELVRTQTIKNENTNDRWWNANSHREHEERGGNEKEKGFGFTTHNQFEGRIFPSIFFIKTVAEN